jgi:cytoskeletal protein RodZ
MNYSAILLLTIASVQAWSFNPFKSLFGAKSNKQQPKEEPKAKPKEEPKAKPEEEPKANPEEATESPDASAADAPAADAPAADAPAADAPATDAPATDAPATDAPAADAAQVPTPEPAAVNPEGKDDPEFLKIFKTLIALYDEGIANMKDGKAPDYDLNMKIKAELEKVNGKNVTGQELSVLYKDIKTKSSTYNDLVAKAQENK